MACALSAAQVCRRSPKKKDPAACVAGSQESTDGGLPTVSLLMRGEQRGQRELGLSADKCDSENRQLFEEEAGAAGVRPRSHHACPRGAAISKPVPLHPRQCGGVLQRDELSGQCDLWRHEV